MTNGVRWQKERLTRSVRRVAGRYGPVARAPLVCKRSFMVIKVLIRGFCGKCSAGTPEGADTGRNGREAALDMTTPSPSIPPQSLSPLRGEESQWRCGQLDWRRWRRCNIL